MKLYQALEKQLKNEPNFVSDDGQLKKWVVIEKVLDFDENLIELLLEDETLKQTFFKPIAGVLVFRQALFLQFLEQKNYINDSYTQYKNKVGLAIHGKFLKQRNETVLVWPYKDCVLEGGQTREEEDRDEIFFNEILAQDEITQLFEPKVLTNAKRFIVSGEQSFDQFHRNEQGTITDNLIIKGNNILALCSLKKEFAGKIKLIYIDPPYNTKNDSFRYNNNFNHSSWLTFMRNRLDVARKLLRDDGVIFVHCDDNEQAYLKVLMDEIFGRENFIGTIPRKTRNGKSDVPYKFSQDYDWLIVFTKNASKISALFHRNVERKYYKSDDYVERWRLSDLTNQRTPVERPNSDFTMINPKNGNEYPVNPKRCWSVTKDTFQEYYDKGKIVFPGDYDFLNISTPAMRVFENEDNGKTAYVSSDFIINFENGFENTKGNKQIDELFRTREFSYAKPEEIMEKIIAATTQKDDLVLDFHLGSGTTAAVAHKMNRQYIGIEQMNYIETVTVVRLKKVIDGEQGGISLTVNWQGGGSFVYFELKKYNEMFIEQIEKAKTTENLLKIWEKMKSKSFLDYNIDLKKQEEHLDDFKKLTLKEQKLHLCELLDKNQMYVNLSSLNDKDFSCSDEEKKVTKQFYQVKGKKL
ncbi:MAG: site-specific DNA-methyltransferase [Planctomycetaceae bacterium]|jgi:adenine-specific DNA-methyltransferase|nr:site-specific DNA-methyltransferase [Planctomycetaceae bacterium]